MIVLAIIGAWAAVAVPVAVIIGKATAQAERDAARQRHPSGRHLVAVPDHVPAEWSR